MKIRALEWIGLIMTDQLAFLVVAISFLYVFTDPVKEAKSHQVAQETIRDQQKQIQSLENTVKTLKLTGKKAPEKPKKTSAPESLIHVRLFPGTLVVANETGEYSRMDRETLLSLLKERQNNGKQPEVILSAETGMTYTRLTELADELKEHGIQVQFGW